MDERDHEKTKGPARGSSGELQTRKNIQIFCKYKKNISNPHSKNDQVFENFMYFKSFPYVFL